MPEPVMRIAGEVAKPMPRRVNFTIDCLNRATCPAGNKDRAYIYDQRTPGLCLMVTNTGSKAFYLLKKIAGRTQRIRLGSFPDITIEQARKLGSQTAGKLADGIDIQAERKSIRKDATLQEVWDKWFNEHGKPRLRPRTLETDKSRFDTCFDGWKAKKIHSIRPSDAQRLLNTLGESKGHTTANRAVQLLRRLMTFARVNPNPCAKGEIRFFREEPRERYLSGDELAKLLGAIDSETNTTIADFTKLCLWLGQRRGNIASMRWDELDLNRGIWAIPGAKFKTHKPLVVPMAQPAIDVLKGRKQDGEYVFPGDGKGGHLVEPKAGWKRILDRAGLHNIHLHDLRHNVASWAVQNGASLYAVGKVLGHANQATTQRYAHLALDPLRATVQTGTNAMLAAIATANAEQEKKVKSE